MDKIKQQLMANFQLALAEADVFLSAFKTVTVEKNDVFIEEGKVCHKIGLVEKGLLMCVYPNRDKMIVDEFAFENSFVTNYSSFLTRSPSEKEIRCVERCTLRVIDRVVLEGLGKNHPFLERMSRIMNERLFLRTHDRLKSLLLLRPSERYRQLIDERRDLAERIPQYLIAAYLNVKPETISRIRKKMSRISSS
jgi:CRP-like cAMP-binding protein